MLNWPLSVLIRQKTAQENIVLGGVVLNSLHHCSECSRGEQTNKVDLVLLKVFYERNWLCDVLVGLLR